LCLGDAFALAPENGGLPHFKAPLCKTKTAAESLDFTLE
jgi:hypothetical protein